VQDLADAHRLLGATIGVFTPVKQPPRRPGVDIDNRTCNAPLRGPGERGFALLTGRWRVLRHPDRNGA
jgi:hypothetical protein